MLFLGHGSPQNAIEQNQWTAAFRAIGQQLRQQATPPTAVLMLSAHWDTAGLRVSSQPKPRTIHDFYGFGAALQQFQYPAAGDPLLASRVLQLLASTQAVPDVSWGFDHGCWSVLAHLMPDAALPVVQLSIDSRQSAAWHLQLGTLLQPLRQEGVLIVGSGNLVHNLGLLDWQNRRTPGWAVQFRDQVKAAVEQQQLDALTDYQSWPAANLAVPHPDHLLPLFPLLGATSAAEKISWFNDSFALGSLAMTSLRIG
jgi:4,5-DOPA dioxygenase extradiol